MERQIERVLILADEPILKRPIPVELGEARVAPGVQRRQPLCDKVQRYLERYTRDYAVTHASATASASHGATVIMPNEYGLPSDSHWDFSAQGFVQPSDYLLASGGVVAYQGRANPTGTELTLGFDWAQIDAGYRPHWLSPMTDSSTLISTEAPTMPAVTLSNWEPLTRLGFQYEFFLAKMDQTGKGNPPGDNILYNGVLEPRQPATFRRAILDRAVSRLVARHQPPAGVRGRQRLADSASVSVPRLLQAERPVADPGQPAGLLRQPLHVSRARRRSPIYAQYAGEDNSDGGSYLLGNAALSVGIDFPRIWHHFDLTYEISEWQNIWYVHNIFLDGMTNNGIVEGNWGADQRVFNDGVGARMPDAAHRLGAALRRLPARAGAHRS